MDPNTLAAIAGILLFIAAAGSLLPASDRRKHIGISCCYRRFAASLLPTLKMTRLTRRARFGDEEFNRTRQRGSEYVAAIAGILLLIAAASTCGAR